MRMPPGKQTIVVFGGTGFLGRRVVTKLARRGYGVRVAVRHPEVASDMPRMPTVQVIRADIRNPIHVSELLEGCTAAVNCVSLYSETADATFRDVHVTAAMRLAETAARQGVRTLVHISGIGADPASRSSYIAARGEGELQVRRAMPSATILRPSVMFGKGDGFIASIARVLQRSPVFPMFGNGETRLQPIHVDDVAQAVVAAATGGRAAGKTLELGGDQVATYREIVRHVARAIARQPRLLSVPFWIWTAVAWVTGLAGRPVVTTGQVALMRKDNVVSDDRPGIAALGIEPVALDTYLDAKARVALHLES